ncbi:hypothetical protein LCGC14_3095800, partial [marine sediment metagenome]
TTAETIALRPTQSADAGLIVRIRGLNSSWDADSTDVTIGGSGSETDASGTFIRVNQLEVIGATRNVGIIVAFASGETWNHASWTREEIVPYAGISKGAHWSIPRGKKFIPDIFRPTATFSGGYSVKLGGTGFVRKDSTSTGVIAILVRNFGSTWKVFDEVTYNTEQAIQSVSYVERSTDWISGKSDIMVAVGCTATTTDATVWLSGRISKE